MLNFVLVASLVACAYGAVVPERGLPIFPDGRIVGGEDAKIEDIPWQISMIYGSSHRCGGSIVNANTIITAAHCLVGTSVSSLSIRAGSANRGSGGVVVKVSSTKIHPQYNGNTVDYDIGVMKLAENLSFGSTIGAIRLATQGQTTPGGSPSSTSGWGTLSSGGGSLPTTLQVVRIPIVDQAECRASYGSSAITDRMICAGLKEGGKDACQGDSGGPLVVENTLVGLTSWGRGCALPNYPGVWARVSSMRDWFDANSQ